MQKVAGPKGNRWGEKWNRVRSFISLTTIQKWLHIRYQAICTANRTASWFFYSLDAPSFRILEWDGLSSSTSSISVTIALLSFQFCLFLLLSLKIDVESDMRRTLRGNRKSRILSEAKWEKKRWNLLVMVGRIRRRDLLFYFKKNTSTNRNGNLSLFFVRRPHFYRPQWRPNKRKREIFIKSNLRFILFFLRLDRSQS